MTVTHSLARKRFDTALLSSAIGASMSSRHDIPEHISGNEANECQDQVESSHAKKAAA